MVSPIVKAESILLRRKVTVANPVPATEETSLLLSEKLDELFSSGYQRDEVFGIAIPLLIQGKVRIEIGDESERLEIADPSLRFQRTAAVQVFDDYFAQRSQASPR